MDFKTKIATSAVAGILTLAVTGAAASAAFVPDQGGPVASGRIDAPGQVASERGPGNGKGLAVVEAVLERLVANGTITAEQQAKILEELRAASAPKPDGRHLKQLWSQAMRLSVEYLGVERGVVTEALRAGQSLGELATATTGKSRQGLIDHLVAGFTVLAATAVTDGKVTQEQADEFTAALPERAAAFVDQVYEKKPAREVKKKLEALKEDLKERRSELKERAKELKETWKQKRKELKESAAGE